MLLSTGRPDARNDKDVSFTLDFHEIWLLTGFSKTLGTKYIYKA